MACCWKSIYQGLKKSKSCNVTVWNIMVQGHQIFVTISSKFMFLLIGGTAIVRLWLGFRSSRPEVFLGKSVLKIYSKFTGEHPCRSAISIKLQSTFVEITLRHGCSPVKFMHNFRTPFYKNTSGWLLLNSEPIWQHYGSSSEWSRYTGSTGDTADERILLFHYF